MIEETAGDEVTSSSVTTGNSESVDSPPIASRTRTSQNRRKPKIEWFYECVLNYSTIKIV